MTAIYKRELKSYFHSFIGFLFIGVTLFFIGLYFTIYNLIYGYPYFSYALASILFVFSVSVPILTMKALAEEKKQKTDQLILTAPVTVGQIVTGKFLALSTVFAIPVAIISIYPLILTRFGTIPLGEAYMAILGFFLYGETCIAIGLFVSSLTESLVISAVISFALLFLGYMMSSICNIISSSGNLLTRILQCYDLYTPFYYMVQGTLNLESIAYYLSITLLLLFLTVQIIQKRRYSVSVKKLQLGAYSSGMIVIVLLATIVFNMIVSQLPESVKSVDITSSKLYSLTDDTKAFLDSMEEDVTIYVLVKEENEDTTVGQTLDRYEEYSDHIKVEYVNPAVNPNFAYQYTTASVKSNSLIVVSDKRSTVVDASDFYVGTVDYTTYTTTTTGYDGEGQITSALDYVLSDDIAKIYFTEGHGELSLGSTFTSALEKGNIEYESVNLLTSEAVPEDASCLVILAPTSDFSEDDVKKVQAFMDAGGAVVAVYGYTDESMSNFDSLLSYMGLSVTKGLVVETNTNNYHYQSQYFLFPNMKYDTLTEGLYGEYYIYTPFAQGIQIADEEAEDMNYTTFLYTSDDAFARIGYDNTTYLEKAEEDVSGPFGIGVRAEKTVGEDTATMVLYSCEQMFTDSVSQMVSGTNLKLFMNTINAYIEGQESNISIPVKNYEVSTLVTNSASIIFLGVVTVIILPLCSLIVGFVIWFRRRKR